MQSTQLQDDRISAELPLTSTHWGMLARTYAAVQDSCIENDRGYSEKVYGYSVRSTEFLHDG